MRLCCLELEFTQKLNQQKPDQYWGSYRKHGEAGRLEKDEKMNSCVEQECTSMEQKKKSQLNKEVHRNI